jgi:hypothetical protein
METHFFPHFNNSRRPGFEPGSGHVGFVADKVALGQVFSEYFGFPCQTSFHQLLHSHPHLSSGAGTIGQKWPQYQGLSPTPQKNVFLVTFEFLTTVTIIIIIFLDVTPCSLINANWILEVRPASVFRAEDPKHQTTRYHKPEEYFLSSPWQALLLQGAV